MGRSVKSAALTFYDNPFLRLKKQALPIYDFETRARLLDTDIVIFAEFDEKFAAMSGDEFLKSLLDTADIAGITVGADYRFSKGAACGIDELRTFLAGKNIPLFVADTVFSDGVKVSSSNIRRRLLEGDVRSANAALGRPYFISGTVEKGTRTGLGLGFPTANIRPKEGILRLKEGVYLTRTSYMGRLYASVTNAGGRPTFDGNGPYMYETHIDGVSSELYGSYMEIEFLERIRDIVKFKNKDALIEALKADRERISDVPLGI